MSDTANYPGMEDVEDTGDMIEGVVQNVVFTNAENGYTVLRLDTIDGAVTAAGNIPGVSQGERLLLTGSWMTHLQYGDQFKTESFEIRPPTDADDIFRYLASGAIKNIGPAKARDIVDKFGSNALLIIENDSDKLSEIKGISQQSARKIGEEYRRRAGLRRLIDFFTHYGIKPIVATRVYKEYGDNAAEAVKDDPYLITSELFGADFFEADAIALDLGFESGCIQRLSAALIFELVHNLGNGHTFIPAEKLTAAVCELISVERDIVEEALYRLCDYGDIVIDEIAGVKGCYLKHMFDAECYVAMRLSEMAAGRQDARAGTQETQGYGSPAPHSDLIQEIECEQGIKYAKLQRDALRFADDNGVLALTGGPGTGKTTTVHGILTLFDSLGLKTALCAPTGRAAKRLSELCEREAVTIHRLLGANIDNDGYHVFDRDEQNPLDADAVIVDESSMIDILLMHALLKAMKVGCRLIMVGDADQLPPIGPGNVFLDAIRSGVIPVVALEEIFRQSADSGIVKCAHTVNNGIMPDLTEKYPDFFFLRRQSEEQLAETVAELCSRRLPENMGIDPSQIQVLSPTRKRMSGTVALNKLLREKLNPQSPSKREKKSGDFLYRTGDKVMQTRNNYDILWQSPDMQTIGSGVFNGDIGVIKDIDHDKETVTVDFEDKLVTYVFDKLSELEPAFAMTVHKSQGSEYNAVVFAMTSASGLLLSRSVLYTAMTRAKSLLIIVGKPEIMEKMVSNDKRYKRYSGLRARMAKHY